MTTTTMTTSWNKIDATRPGPNHWMEHTHNQGFMEFWLNDSHYYYRNLIITVSYYPMNYVM